MTAKIFDAHDPLMSVSLPDFIDWATSTYGDEMTKHSLTRMHGLKNEGLQFLGEVLTRTEADLARLPSFSRKSLSVLNSALGRLGQKLSPHVYGHLSDDELAILRANAPTSQEKAFARLNRAALVAKSATYKCDKMDAPISLERLPALVADLSLAALAGNQDDSRILLLRTKQGDEPVTITISATRGNPPAEAVATKKAGFGEG